MILSLNLCVAQRDLVPQDRLWCDIIVTKSISMPTSPWTVEDINKALVCSQLQCWTTIS
jgi:hypothetical protein